MRRRDKLLVAEFAVAVEAERDAHERGDLLLIEYWRQRIPYSALARNSCRARVGHWPTIKERATEAIRLRRARERWERDPDARRLRVALLDVLRSLDDDEGA